MTKRFGYNVNKNTIECDGKFVAYVMNVDGYRIANKMNILLEENEQLKQDKKRLIGYLHRYGKVDVEDIDEVILDKEYYDEYGELYGGDVE